MKNFIKGKWVSRKDTLDVRFPYTGELIDTVPLLDFEEINEAILYCAKSDVSLTHFKRYEILISAANEVKAQKEEFARLITSESGISIKSTLHEVDRAVQALLFSAEEARNLNGSTYETDIIPDGKQKIGFTVYEPVGTVLAITPFNHPLNSVVHKVGPAIAAGNKIILKPSEKTPLTAIRFVEVLLKCGLPKEMIAVITCDAKKVSAHLVSHPLINMVSFTGSTEIGQEIHKNMGIKKSVLELGGNGAMIILDDANLNEIIPIAVKGAYDNSGQRCTSVKRILVHEKIAEEFSSLFVDEVKKLKFGNPFDESVDVGTVIDEEAAIRIEKRLQSAKKNGATILCGGVRKGAMIQPTVISGVKTDMELVSEETFGPTAPLIQISSDQEAVKIANSTMFGLQSGICTTNISRAISIARQLKVGGVMINEAPGFRVEQFPFGGVKQSGIGREGIKHATKEMSDLKLIVI